MGMLAGAGRVRAWGLGRPGVVTSELRLVRTKYIDLHGGWGAGPGDEEAGETPNSPAGAAWRPRLGVLMPRCPPTPPRPRHKVPWTLGGPGLVNGGSGAVPLGAQSTDIP